MAKPLCLVTGNANKVREFGELVDGRFEWTNQKLDVPELQGDPETVAREKCRRACELYGGPVITEDVSFCVEAWRGLPGVYIKYFLESVGPAGMVKMLEAFDDKRAYAQCIYAYCEKPGDEPTLFVGRCPGKVVPEAGVSQFGKASFDAIFVPDADSQGRTFAQMDAAEKNACSHRGLASKKLAAHFEKILGKQ